MKCSSSKNEAQFFRNQSSASLHEQNRSNKTNRTRRDVRPPRTETNRDSQSFPQKKTKSPYHSYPAVVAYRDILDYRTISADQAELIAQAAGADPNGWTQFLKELSLAGKSGQKAANIGVVVEAFGYYQSGDLPAVALDKAWRRYKGEPNTEGANNNGKFNSRKTATDNLKGNIEWLYGPGATN
jgi:hypothetical protein